MKQAAEDEDEEEAEDQQDSEASCRDEEDGDEDENILTDASPKHFTGENGAHPQKQKGWLEELDPTRFSSWSLLWCWRRR